MALPSPSVHCSMTCHGLRPRYVSARSPCRVFRCWLPVHEHLGLVRLWNYFGAQSLHLRLADHPLPSGSTGSVTLPCAEFRAGPVVSLWPGWFIQLAYLGFPWRTHFFLLFYFSLCKITLTIPRESVGLKSFMEALSNPSALIITSYEYSVTSGLSGVSVAFLKTSTN